MADNVGYTPGEGAQIAADEIAGVLHQRAKVQFGDDGSATDVSAANPLPVAVVGVSTETTLSALKASVDALNAKIAALEGGRMPVALPAGSSGLSNTELRATPLEVISSDSQFLEALAFRALAKLTYTLTGQRVDCGGSSVAVSSLPTLANVTALAGIGYNTQNGQAIQQSQLAYQCGFRRNIT